jgi:hypothetical protein
VCHGFYYDRIEKRHPPGDSPDLMKDCLLCIDKTRGIDKTYTRVVLQRSVFSPRGAGSSRWRGPAVPVLAAGEAQRILGTDQW